MNAYYKGQLLCGPRGPAGPDGNPVGTVISFLGLAAPKDYLICDGAEYHIADYPELAEFFRQQFGAANHFGGDGATSFAVPDMRNLFLRGYHGESEEPLSGNVGEKQEATKIPNIYVAAYGRGLFVGKNPSLDGNWPDQVDRKEPEQSTYSQTSATVHSGAVSAHYTTRPVNMAVLFCIKAVESIGGLDEYDTEDGWHVRKWANGYVELLVDKSKNIGTWGSITPGVTYSQFDSMPLPFPLVKKYETYATACDKGTSGAAVTALQKGADSDLLDAFGPLWLISFSTPPPSLVGITIKITGRWE